MSTAEPIRTNAALVDMGVRLARSASVVASPTTTAETIIASVTCSQLVEVGQGILVMGFAAFTVGTDGVGANVKLRKTDASGSTLKATGITTVVAANLVSRTITAFDTSPTLPGQVYVMTLTVASASAGSTVSAVEIDALIL